MDNKFLIVVAVVLAFILFLGIMYYQTTKISDEEGLEQAVYRGPIQKNYNETHFRKTGESIPLEVLNG